MQVTNSSQEGRLTPRASPQASQADSALPLSTISQTGNPQASLADSTPSHAESAVSQAGSSPASWGDGTLSQVESDISWAGSSQASLEDSTLPQAESAVLPQAVRCSARLRALQGSNNPQAGNTPNNSSRQAGNTPRVDSTGSQSDSIVPQVVSLQAGASQEARSSPSRHNSAQGSSPLEEPNPKWVINLSSKPSTKAQRSVLAKGPIFVVSPRHPPNLEYITAIEAACTKLSQQDAEEIRANINPVLRASHPPNLI